jgi:transposase
MPRSRPPYPPEFREQIVELHRAGRSFAELAAEFEPSEQTIRAWVAHAKAAPIPSSTSLPADEREELRRLRREVKQLRLEREILSKAAAWFARESNALPGTSSSS